MQNSQNVWPHSFNSTIFQIKFRQIGHFKSVNNISSGLFKFWIGILSFGGIIGFGE